jgi:hypothetical protein
MRCWIPSLLARNIISSPKARSSAQRSFRASRAVLRLEPLEGRLLLDGSFSFRPVAFLGGPAPGLEGGSFPDEFEAGHINNHGEVIFNADVSTGGQGIFLDRQGQLTQIARTGEAAPGGGTFGAGVVDYPPLNERGDAAFIFSLDPTGFRVAGVYRYSAASDTISAVMIPGVTPAPGGGTFLSALCEPELNNQGDIAFSGVIPVPGTGLDGFTQGRDIVVARPDGSLQGVMRPGDAAPGGRLFDYGNEPAMNERGDVVFTGHLAGDPVQNGGVPVSAFDFSGGGQYLWDATTGHITTLFGQGQVLPASAGGGKVDFTVTGGMNDEGQVLFLGALASRNGVDGSDNYGLFLDSGGHLVGVARPGDAMPGGGNLRSVSYPRGNVAINERGAVAFLAILDTGEQGAYLWSNGQLRLLARSGTDIPGVGRVQSLSFFGETVPPYGVKLNDRGQVLFTVKTATSGALVVATPQEDEQGGSDSAPMAALSGHEADSAHTATANTLLGELLPSTVVRSEATPSMHGRARRGILDFVFSDLCADSLPDCLSSRLL